jgi:hypothetical protein
VTSTRPTPINDDHGDQFPGALPARTTPAPEPGASERLVRMHPAYPREMNPVMAADRQGPASEPAQTSAEESSGAQPTGAPDRGRRVAGRPTPSRGQSGRRPRQAASRIGRFTRSPLARFDRYTLEVFNPGAPYRTRT